MKHCLTSRFWPLPKDNSTWECAGSAVHDFLRQKLLLQKLYGWTDPAPLIPGKCLCYCLHSHYSNNFVDTFKLAPFLHQFHRQATHTWQFIIFCDSQASKAVNVGSYDFSLEWNPCVYTITASEDNCRIGSWVFAKSPIDVCSFLVALVQRPTYHNNAGQNHCQSNYWNLGKGNIYQVASMQHKIFGMPTLSCCYDETSILILPTIVSFIFFFTLSFKLMYLSHKGHPVWLQCAAWLWYCKVHCFRNLTMG